ncbi:MAG: RNA polymerase sigma factor [Planctomycetaceae bacterium]
MTERSDVDLMLAFQAGDESAYSVLVQRHENSVMSLTYRYLGNRADAEDLSQEVFLRIYRARKRYRPEAKFTTWLYRVAANACLNEMRRRKTRATHGASPLREAGEEEGAAPAATGDAGAGPVEALAREELRGQVRAAVDALPERQRLALLMNKFHGLGYEELAQTLELSVPAVKSLLTRARENVRARIEPYLHAARPAKAARSEPV